MRTLKYIILGVLLISLSLSSMTVLFGQKGSIEFLETYSCSEITSKLEPGDRFFQLIELNQNGPESSILGICSKEKAPEVWKYLQSRNFLKQLPEDLKLAWGVQEEGNHQTLYALKKAGKASSGPIQSDIQEVNIYKENQGENYELFLSFNEKGAKKWELLTGKNVERDIAIVIEGMVYSAPTVKEKIKEGNCVISGRFSKSEATRLKALLLKHSH